MANLELETTTLRNTNFLQLMLEVETLVKSGWAIDLKGTRAFGVQYIVVLNRAKQLDVAKKVEEDKDVSETVVKQTTKKPATKQATK